MKEKRFDSLDALKCLCLFMVFYIHAGYSGAEELEYISVFARSGVPFFFMVTGFFYQKTIENKREGKHILKILKLVIITNVFYALWYSFIYKWPLKDMLITQYSQFSLKHLLLYNVTPICEPLWYLSAMLYMLVVVYLLNKMKILDKVVYVMPFLLIVAMIKGPYCMLLFHQEADYFSYRNFLYTALPFFSLGYCYQKAYQKHRFIEDPDRYCDFIFLSCVLTIVEIYFLKKNNLFSLSDLYLTTPLLSSSIFLLGVYANQKVPFFSYLGKRCSQDMYTNHSFIMCFLNGLPYHVFRLLLCYLLSSLFALIDGKLTSFLPKKKV